VASPFLLALHGQLVVVGKRPDGDSMRFVPDRPELLLQLHRADRIRPSSDGSLQLRFEGIDTPETHYGEDAQPLGEEARNGLLTTTGFETVVFDDDGVVAAAEPETRRAVVLSQGAEANGRPVAYVLVDDPQAPPDGQWTEVTREVVRRSANARQLATGLAYPTLYTSTPTGHRHELRAIATEARAARAGVWALDQTPEFPLVNQDSISPGGALVLPKLFRRCTDYLKAVGGGFAGTLPDWLVAVSATGSRPEDDRVVLGDRTEVSLSALIQQRNARIAFGGDLLDIVFVEK
jgi:endonuclease YncB( thermonuclease family)